MTNDFFLNMTNTTTPTLYTEEIFHDHRGTISSFNALDLSPFKRTYYITHPKTDTIRAWQGHQYEQKLFKVIKGKFIVGYVKIDNFQSPAKNLKAEYKILEEKNNEFLLIPKGYANGLKALVTGSIIQVYSDFYLEESLNEKIRFSADKWLDWQSIK
ncbi:dTDP-4-dehydrorhamnose 3,5-epimerase family protein [Roseimarinus sediminis]|uniref:dTDP-4-dehydrorhamnose 3,5-epimerase family protein n=1 Tax=Roseimarinus sediminis TaxID=1610899 RepID=UPI003D2537C3